MSNCCEQNNNTKKGLKAGLIAGIAPHTFCILFIVFSVLGATGATAITKKLLILQGSPLLFIALSLLFTTLFAAVYLHKTNNLSPVKIKTKWKYLSVIYTTTLGTSLAMIFIFFPLATNLQPQYAQGQENQVTEKFVVDIPCTGHAPLIISEIRQLAGVQNVRFLSPDTFSVTFDPLRTSVEKISSLEIFREFKLK